MSAKTTFRLGKIAGFGERENDVVYARPMHPPATSVVVFFPGDIQDYPEVMETDLENNQHTKWNLESVSEMLENHFQNSHVVVIKPCRMELKVFSCYDNFVPSNDVGVPSHIPMHHAVHHLEQLLHNTSLKIKNDDFKGLDLILVGFSKGCVVLNQFLHEIHHLSTSESSLRPIHRITDMYWLDGGHSGAKNTWITSKKILQSFAKLGVTVHIHVTPYQLNDERHPWVGKEEKIFREILSTLGVTVNRFVHFNNLPPSLDNHFEVLNVFR